MSKYKGRHRKATKVEKTVAKATLVGVGAGVVPLTFMGGTANAASVDVWEKIAYCESGGQWNLNGGHADSTGGLQIQTRTWVDFGGLQYAPTAGQATKREQILIAEKILAAQGPTAWAVTVDANGAMKGCHGILFRGGPDPYANNTPTPKPTPATPKPKKDKPVKNVPANKGKGKSNKATYTVVKGDTLYDIAITHGVGDGGLDTWKPLYKVNKKVVGDNPHYILPGQVLHIPGAKPEKPAKAEKEKSVKYTVRAGDTLSYLAQHYYGDAKEYKRIYEANRDVLTGGPDALEVGMKLTIPGTTKDAPAKRKVQDTVSNSGYVSPLAAGTYRIGDNIINAGGCVSRSCGGHSGLDLSASHGTQVKSVAAGTVVHAGYGGAGAAYGDHVIIKHNDGRYTLYGHLSSHTVSEGQSVAAGRWIGSVGSTGTSSGPHLHLEVRTSATAFGAGVFIDPVTYLRNNGVTL